ncbi:MAG TPA: caspase family protein [Chryseolinea sp.]
MRTFSQKACLCFLLVLTIIGSKAQAPRIVVNPLGHSAKIHNLLFTPDGHKIISVSEDKTIRIWQAETGEMLKKFESQIGEGPEGMFYASALSPDGKLLAVAGYQVSSESENYIIIIDLEKGTQVSTAVGHTDVINSLSFSGNGKYLASGSADNTVKIWKVEAAPRLTVIANIPVPSAVSCVAFNSVTQDLAVAHESADILVFGLATLEKGATKFPPRVLKQHKGTIIKVVYTLDGSFMASSSFENELILWKADGSIVKEFDNIENPINAIAFSSDSKIMVGLDVIGKGKSWGIPAGNKFSDYTGHDNTVFSATFAPSHKGSYVVASAGGVNNEIILWNPINGLAVRKIKGKGDAVQALAFGDGMELFIAQHFSKDKKPLYKTSFNFESLGLNRNPAAPGAAAKELNKGISLSGQNALDLPKGKKIQTDENQDGRILDYHGMADGSVVVASDFSLKMFDRNGYLSKEFVGHYGAVRAVTISKDGRYLASGGEDQTIMLWKLSETGFAPSLRQAFEDVEWSRFFSSLPVDSLTKEPTKKAWLDVIAYLKSSGNKAYKSIEDVYKTLGEQVIPFATLFLTEDQEWICWTPRGYFACSSSGGQYFGWHVNKGINHLADFYSAEQYFELLYRPTDVASSFKQGKRVEDILRESGERIFDLSKLHRPSVGFFDITATTKSTDLLKYDQGKYFTQARTIPITVDIYDGGGGVKEVNIYQNDKLIISDSEVKTTREGEKRSKTYAVEMANETNKFKVKIMNFQKIESRSDELVIEYVGEVIATSTLHVLAVGINKYKNASYNLNYAQPDASSFVEKLNEKSKVLFKHVNRVEIYDEDATKENIAMGFKAMVAQAKPEDVFMFYYAGHGTLDDANNDEYYLVPTDITKLYGDPAQLHARGISATDIRGFLTQIKSQKQIVLMDACHSGGAVKSLSTRGVASDEKAMVQLARSSGVVMIASSGTKQLATEFEALKHGVFTYALLEALDGKADNGDSKITVNELKLYMEERVPELTKQYGGQAQYPTGYITGNDFPISILEK